MNTRNGKEIANNVVIAESIFERMKGLLGRQGIKQGEALWIKPCKSIHTVGMKFSIDVVFLDFDNRVIDIRGKVPPNRLTRIFLKANTVLELPAGTLSLTETRSGDKVSFIE